MSIEKITNHPERALDRLPNRFSRSSQFRDLIELIGNRHQEIENTLVDLLELRGLSSANGKQLDNAGQILNVDRDVGENDASYRSRLFSATAQLEKSGEIESVIEVFGFLYSTTSVIYAEIYPAAFSLTAHVATDDEDPELDQYNYTAIQSVRAGGVDFHVTLSPQTDYLYLSDVSEVDANGDGPIDADHGLGDESLLEGGMLSRALFFGFEIFSITTEDSQMLITESGDELTGVDYD